MHDDATWFADADELVAACMERGIRCDQLCAYIRLPGDKQIYTTEPVSPL